MNTSEITALTARLCAERGWAEDSPHAAFLLSLISSRESARHVLRTRVQALRNRLDSLDLALQADSPLLNTLGALQQDPPAVEAGTGELAAASKALRSYLATFPADASLPLGETRARAGKGTPSS